MTDERKGERKTDADQVKEIINVFSDKIPGLLNSLADVLYGREQAKKYGEAVAGFFKSLKDSGMTDAQAYELTKQYMSAMNLPGMIGAAIGGKGKFGLKVKKEIHDQEDEGEDEHEA